MKRHRQRVQRNNGVRTTPPASTTTLEICVCRRLIRVALLFFALIIVECNAFWAQTATRELDCFRASLSFKLFATQKEESKPTNDVFATPPLVSQNANGKLVPRRQRRRRKMGLMWCGTDYCKDNIRERVVDEHVLLNGPATGQVAYYWDPTDDDDDDDDNAQQSITRYILIFVRPGDDKLLKAAADAIKEWTVPTKSKNGFRDKIKVMYVLFY